MDEQLGGLQSEIMRLLWERGSASVAELHTQIQAKRGVAYTTISTVLRRMEKRGIVSHVIDGRTFIYSAVLSEDKAGKSAVSSLVNGLFGGNASRLVSYLLEGEEVDSDEMSEIGKMIRDRTRHEKSAKRLGKASQ